ncbi:hypothetical protein EIN_183460 [Entamoeba invadens IP1]|uniref:hypothetical protein n=1 Tax=Entamoeba invadens IP1 TaxID=370355 RepID=UPI0002C3E071|nr:hypothetical protein EIN_183460 [Entamoeba invadens IP1]ELP94059.1 hypothetical protein EIN_183460 [Entamoeba invadens IP1]|eukprot:XP_004260830.1 hypothetical protein EIN_183460 [Entamoeba invadens IP1]
MSLSPADYPEHYTINKESKYYREMIPRPMYEQLFAKAKMMACGFLCQQDPSHAQIFKENWESIAKDLEEPFFKETMYEFFAGCFDPESVIFKVSMRSLVAKISLYGRFCIERNLAKDAIETIPIKKPIYIVALPRSGSTFTHTMLGCDKRAKTVMLYEHICPGNKTTTTQARQLITEQIIGQVTTDGQDMNKCHNMDNVMMPEEELFFMETLAHTHIFGNSIPRWEQYRESCYTRDWDKVYYAVLDEIRMSALEFPMKEDGHFLLKCVSHFMTPAPFFNIMNDDKFDSKIVWIHREPVDEFKSCFYLLLNARARFKGDLGEDDYLWLQQNILKVNEICLKNSFALREKWIAAKPERANRIIDIGFREMIADPVAVTQRIYDKFGLDLAEDVKTQIVAAAKEGDRQGAHGRMAKNKDDFLISDDKIREQFKWYYDMYGKYMPKFYN